MEGADTQEKKFILKGVLFGRGGGLKNILKFRRHDRRGPCSFSDEISNYGCAPLLLRMYFCGCNYFPMIASENTQLK